MRRKYEVAPRIWWRGEDEPITYPLHVHLAIAAAVLLGFAGAWFVLPVIERAVAR